MDIEKCEFEMHTKDKSFVLTTVEEDTPQDIDNLDSGYYIEGDFNKINPMPILEKRITELYDVPKGTMFAHIKYDEAVNENYDYQIIRELTHDGTAIFILDLIFKVLQPIANKESYCKANAPEDLNSIKDIKYTIGDIKIEGDYGTKEINGMKMEGQTDVAYLPVRVEYVL